MALTERLALLIQADARGAVSGLDKVGKAADKNLGGAEKRVDSFGKGLSKAGVGMIAVGAAALVGLGKAAKAFDEAHKSELKLENSLKNNPRLAGESSKAYLDLATSIQSKTAADADDITAGIAVLAQGKLNARQMKELIPLTVDLARKKGIDEVTAFTLASKAAGGNAGALKKAGIAVDETKAKTDAYGATVDALRNSVGGFAEEEGKTFAGQMERVKNQVGDLEESLGAGVVDALSSMFSVVGGGAEALNRLDPAILSTTGKFATFGAAGLVAAGATSALIGQVIKARANFALAKDGLVSFVSSGKGLRQIGAGLGAVAAAGVAMKLWADQAERADRRVASLGKTVRSGIDTASFSDLVDKLARTGEEIDRLQGQKGSIKSPFDIDLAGELGKGIEELGAFRKETQATVTAALTLANTMGISTDAALVLVRGTSDVAVKEKLLAGEFDATTDAAALQEDAITQLTEALSANYDALNRGINAEIDFEAALDGLGESLKTGKLNLDINTEAGRANRQSLIDLGESIVSVGQDRLAESGSIAVATSAVNDHIARLEAELTQAGYTKDQIKLLIDTMNLTPKDITTVFRADTDAASTAVKNLYGDLVKLNGVMVYGIQGPQGPVKAKAGALAPKMNAAGGDLSEGWNSAGEQGTELMYKQGSKVRVFSNAQSKQMAMSASVSGGAAGVSGGAPVFNNYGVVTTADVERWFQEMSARSTRHGY